MITVDSLLLADAAIVADGKLYIHGAGWNAIWAPTFPVIQQALNVAMVLRVPWNDTNVEHQLELDIKTDDGVSILPSPGPMRGPLTIGRPPQIPPGDDIIVPLVFNLINVPFNAPGGYVVVMHIQGVEARRFPLRVTLLASLMGGGQM